MPKRCFSKLSGEEKQRFARLYFDKELGIGYSFGRIHMNSCDFSLGNYACCQEESPQLDEGQWGNEPRGSLTA
ncbi:MAG TPA: hypothetical protein H9742_12040 [Candidatus Acetatifactor stercoripullorum]|uniref:Uncharacterized protein n=1 Tax=Candidatus Acetatifactor stercoripullorum TaxID=2838414 RepID=A0A9D1R784_9FIRM|nr:hypothetical protein [Candidatus Acetatifactor stercoripullorum]HIW82225.1 hypothetical protein [Candidatus Acetatifactor stercoripullorum]